MEKGMFRNSTFVRLFLATITSQLGTIIGNMAFAFYLLDRYASQSYYATLAELMYSLPTLTIFFLVGVVADRFDRQKIAVNSDWIRVVLTAALFGAISLHLLPVVFAILFLRSAVSKFFGPAESGLLQSILDKDDYTKAAGLNQTMFGVFMLFGTGLGAAAYHFIGIEGAVIVDGISFLLSGLLIRSCRISEEGRLPNGRTTWQVVRVADVWGDFKSGFVYIVENRLLFAILCGFFIFGFINGGFAVLPMFTMKYKLAPEHYERYASMFAIFLGIGFLIGSALGTMLLQKIAKHHVIIAGLVLASGLTLWLAFTENVWMYLVIVLLTGIVLAPMNIALGGWLPEIVAPGIMGRVNAWIDPIMMLAQSAALGLLAFLYPSWISLGAAYVIMAACMLAVFVMYALTLPGLVRRSGSGQPRVAGKSQAVKG